MAKKTEGKGSRETGGPQRIEIEEGFWEPGFDNNPPKTEESHMAETKPQDTTVSSIFERLLARYQPEERRGIFSPPPSETELRRQAIQMAMQDILKEMELVVETSRLTHPEQLAVVLEEFKDEQDLRRIVMLDWLDRVYRSFSRLGLLHEYAERVLHKELSDLGILGPEEEPIQPPKGWIEPVLEHLAEQLRTSTALRR